MRHIAPFPAAVLAAALLTAPGEAAPPPLLGQPGPAFHLRSVEGFNLSLADLRGKIIVLHFGASW